MKKFYLLSTFLLSVSSLMASPFNPGQNQTLNWGEASATEDCTIAEPMSYRVAVAKGLVNGVEAQPLKSKENTAKRTNTSTITTFRGYNISYGYLQFNLARPVSRTLVWSIDSLYATAAERVGDDYYVIAGDLAESSSIPHRLLKIDEQTGEYSVVARYVDGEYDVVMTDATWDALNSRMLVMASDVSYYNAYLYSLNLKNGKFTLLAAYPGIRFYTLAADLDGQLYAIDNSGDLYQIDGVNYQTGKIGSTGFVPRYLCSMAFDQRYHNLHWANCSGSSSNLINIDLLTGEGTNVNYIGNSNTSYELSGMNLAYDAPDNSAPAAVTNTVVTPAVLGGSSARITWTNPSSTYGGSTLGKIDKIVVYIDNAAAQTLTNLTAGATADITLSNISSGMHTFKIVPFTVDDNKEYAGQMVERIAWVGADLPAAPSNITLQRLNSSSAKVTWDAPSTVGIHGGYVNPESLKYRISRTNSTTGDSICLQKVYRKGLEYTDETITESGSYFYTIQSLSSDYGDMARSEQKFAGPAYEVPYGTSFNSNELVALWDLYDFDGDGRTWQRGASSSYMISYSSYAETANDNRMVSPPIKLEQDSTYYVYFENYSGFSKDYPKTISVWYGKDKDPLNQTLLKTISFADKTVHYMRVALPITETAEYYFTVQDHSIKTSSSTKMSNFIIITKHTGWAEGTITDNNNRPLQGAIVQIPNTEMSYTTDVDGKYKLDFIPEGRYAVQISKYGYKTVNDSIDYYSDKATIYNQTINPLNVYSINGKVTDVNGDNVVGAKIKISGYGDDRVVYTDNSGKYSVSDLYDANYAINLLKYKYESVSDSIALQSDKVYDLVISPKILQPSAFNVQTNGSSALISWGSPLETFRHDSGIFASQTGALVGTEYYVFGTVFDSPAVLKSIDWVTTSYQGPHNYINLFIFDLKDDKTPSNNVLYKALNVPSNGDEVWNHHDLPAVVEAPNGFYLAASYTGMVSLAMDSGSDEGWPYLEDVNYYSRDYRTDSWSKVVSKRNYLFRANGGEVGDNIQEYAYRYKVWRFIDEDGFDDSKWTLLTPEQGTTDLSITDDLSKLSDGTYIYAIKAVYNDDKDSDIIYSDDVIVKNGTGGINNVLSDVLTVYPNPVKGTIYASRDLDHAQLFSLGGTLVAEVSNAAQIDVSNVPDGIYLLHVTVDNQSFVKKIIIKK